jgi:hypothetical protein
MKNGEGDEYAKFLRSYAEHDDLHKITEAMKVLEQVPRLEPVRGFPKMLFRPEAHDDESFVALPGFEQKTGLIRRKVPAGLRFYCSQWEYCTVVLLGSADKAGHKGAWQSAAHLRMPVGRLRDIHNGIVRAIEEEALLVNPVIGGIAQNGFFLPNQSHICEVFELTEFLP